LSVAEQSGKLARIQDNEKNRLTSLARSKSQTDPSLK
jgi:hypothetical protein